MKNITPLLFLTVFTVALLQACGSESTSTAQVVQGTEILAVAGSYDNSISVDGVERTYHLHIPPSFNITSTSKLLLHMHGTLGDDKVARDRSGFDDISDQEGFIVVYPNSTVDGHWNDGRDPASNADDIGYIKALISKLSTALNVGTRHVYMSGMSNGSIFSHRFACNNAEGISAIAAVAGPLAVNTYAQCNPSQPVSVLMFHGEDDPYVSWDGGDIPSFGGAVRSVTDTMNYWAQFNGCPVVPIETNEPNRDPSDGTLVSRIAFDGCNNQTSVVLYDIAGGGHTWPGSSGFIPPEFGNRSKDIDASSLIWDFFNNHTKP